MLALLNGFTQETRLLTLATPLGPNKLIAECLRGEEGLSQCYEFRLTALSLDAAIALKSLLGQPVLVSLLTAASRDDKRPFHGHVTSARCVESDGGLARYEITIGPWYAFLAHGRDSRVFQDKTVFDILDALFGGWSNVGRLVPAWRYDVLDRAVYPVRSLTCQYQESNQAFAERLMREEGLFYYFEHTGDPASSSLGAHTMVIADHNGSFQVNAQEAVRFKQPGAVMKEDSMDRWRTIVHLRANAVELSSWDYRTVGSRPVSASGASAQQVHLPVRDVPGAYGYETREQGQRMADNQMKALDASRAVHTGAGTVRTLAPGTRFTLHGQAQVDAAAIKGGDDARSFAIVRVVHLAHNNLSTDVQAAVTRALGQGELAAAIGAEQEHSLHSVGVEKGERPIYRNRIDAIGIATPFRSSDLDGNGRLRHPRPSVRGQQTAIVVGPAGATTFTDRDHRVKVQFHWQRGAGDADLSHSRLNHPAPDGHAGAPASDQAGTWVRIATPLAPVAGANWGSVAVPRVGSEVLIDFLDGDIDRPVVIGSLYNGKGATDAQHNLVAQGAGVASGNAPPWFPGQAGAHAHPAALSGMKSQAMSASQSGAGAYSQLVFDDSRGQSRVALQRHAEAHRGTDELNLGHLRHQTDNQRLAPAGFGAELKTERSNALRAGQGMLLASNGRSGATGGQMDTREAQAQITQSAQLQADLASTAEKHNAVLKGAPATLPAIDTMAHSATVVEATGSAADRGAGGAGSATAYSEAQLQLSGLSGIAAVTPANAVLGAGANSSIGAGQDINFAAQGNLFQTVRTGISLFTYGKASSTEKPNQELGIKLHAATGKVSSQSQFDATRLTAAQAVTVASVSKSINVAAKAHVLLTAQGASLKLEGGNIQVHAPGKVEFKASLKELNGPKSSSPTLPLFPRYEGDTADQHFILKSHSGAPVKQRRYRALTGNQTVEGFTDEQGRSKLLDGFLGQIARFELIHATHDEHFVIRDPLGEPVANMRYKIRAADGVEVEGMTDDEGRTALFTSEKIEKVELVFVPEVHEEVEGSD